MKRSSVFGGLKKYQNEKRGNRKKFVDFPTSKINLKKETFAFSIFGIFLEVFVWTAYFVELNVYLMEFSKGTINDVN